MAAPNYHPVEPAFSPLEETTYKSPVSYAEPFPVYDTEHGDVGHAGIEMRERPGARHQDTTHSTTSTLFHGQSDNETQSFLHDPVSKIDTFYASSEYQTYKDNTGRQLRHILVAGSTRWLITFALCGGYVLATRIWQKKQAQSENSKKVYNAITTAISIALGLNIASAFKDMALNMRWVLLSNRKRNLIEMDLLLKADSMQTLTRLVFVTRRPMVILGCIFWLFVNLLAQAGIAMVSLTYGFNADTSHVQYTNNALVTIPDISAFWPQGNLNKSQIPSWQDQAYTAHVYGQSALNLGVNGSWFPKPGDIYDPYSMVFTWEPDVVQIVFLDSPTDAESLSSASVYTSRTINSTYICESHKVTAGGDGSTNNIKVADIGNVTVYQTVPDSTTFFVSKISNCTHNGRCQIVQAFEASKTDPWYYTCNITLSNTYNDPQNVSFISDFMARIATTSIAQTGFVDEMGETGQIYPQNSPWGIPLAGDADIMGATMAVFAAGSIAGATYYNPYDVWYEGNAPSQGVFLDVAHPYFFFLILGLITVCHLVFLLIVAILANRVMVGPEGALSMALLLRPIADALDGVSGGKKNKAFRDAKKNTMVKYEKARNGRWNLHMTSK